MGIAQGSGREVPGHRHDAQGAVRARPRQQVHYVSMDAVGILSLFGPGFPLQSGKNNHRTRPSPLSWCCRRAGVRRNDGWLTSTMAYRRL